MKKQLTVLAIAGFAATNTMTQQAEAKALRYYENEGDLNIILDYIHALEEDSDFEVVKIPMSHMKPRRYLQAVSPTNKKRALSIGQDGRWVQGSTGPCYNDCCLEPKNCPASCGGDFYVCNFGNSRLLSGGDHPEYPSGYRRRLKIVDQGEGQN